MTIKIDFSGGDPIETGTQRNERNRQILRNARIIANGHTIKKKMLCTAGGQDKLEIGLWRVDFGVEAKKI